MSPLYAIVDAEVCATKGLAPEDVAAAVMRGGAGTVQLRAKTMGAADLLALARRLVPAAAAAGVTLVINDRVDVARTAGVGVHVGQGDLPVDEARRLLGPHATIGLSTHTLAQLDSALGQPVTYVAFGPVFATATKLNPDPVVGLDGLRAAAHRSARASVPLVAIGGITLDTAPAVVAAGASAVAVIGDLLRGEGDPEQRARLFLSALTAKLV